MAPNHTVCAGLAVRGTIARDEQWCRGTGWAICAVDVARIGCHYCIQISSGLSQNLALSDRPGPLQGDFPPHHDWEIPLPQILAIAWSVRPHVLAARDSMQRAREGYCKLTCV